MWVVCGRNTALGVFASRKAAHASLVAEGATATYASEHYCEYTRAGEVLSLQHLTQETPFVGVERLFR